MKIILGIGNKGDIYKETRHNSGFQAVDLFASDLGIEIKRSGFQSLYATCKVFDEQILILKPQTYVNLSGNALREAMQFYKVGIEDVIILVDDMDTQPGNIRLRLKGSAGGHNGLKSIIENVGTDQFKRIRIGIGKPWLQTTVDFVLSCPRDDEEYNLWKDGISKATEALEYSLKYSFEKAMNEYNH